MPSTAEAKSVTAIPQTEKPTHYTYLKEFRVDQCPLFLQHKCTQHKPFVCFYWHFMNQRRRRPVRKRDGTFNYNPDVYCSKYDETTGVCSEGDDCPYLHRTAGDTERRYHLRYYKTGACVYDTDSRGYCVKNGPHCAFAHGIHDLRNPVYDIKELQAMESTEEGPNGTSGPNNLDKERNALNEDPKWQDTNYVLANYKTEQCKRPPRLCRQGYACPQFHNNRDRRRSPKKFKYRSTPCPNVKQGDEWGDPTNCENGDNCPYCHTRTEQQFHPEIYKSTKCNDILQTGYCPRGPFCAFAHVDKEISAIRDLGPDHTTDLATILSNALPSPTTAGSQSQQSPNSNKDCNLLQKTDQCSGGEQDLQSSAANKTNNSLPEVLPGHDHFSSTSHPLPTPISRPRSYSSSTNHSGESHYPKAPGSEREDKDAHIRRHLHAIDNDTSLDPLEKSQKKQNIYLTFGVPLSHLYATSSMSSIKTMSPLAKAFYPAAGTVESVVGNALDDLSLDDINVEESIGRDLINDSNAVDSPISAGIVRSGLLGASAPMNIPCGGDMHENRSLSSLSPPVNSPLGSLSRSLQLGTSLSQVASQSEHPLDKAAAAAFYGHSGSFSSAKYSHYPISGMYDFTAPQNMSPGSRIGATQQPSLVSSISAFNSIGTSSLSEIQRLRDEVAANRAALATWENGIEHVRTACDGWRRDTEELSKREMLAIQQRYEAYDGWRRDTEELSKREMLAIQQRDEALAKVNSLQKEVESLSSGSLLRVLSNISELGSLPINKLQQLKEQLNEGIKKIDKVILYQTMHKCIVCEEKEPGVTISPCNHYVLCNQCAPHQKNCPFCEVEITSFTDINASL